MRLQKYIAKAGITSRRKAEKLIRDGRIKVNGKIVKEMGVKIDPEKDVIKYNDKKIYLEEKFVYLLLNKPEEVVTTLSDQFNRTIVTDLIKGVKQRIYPVGRLDYDTSGLLLLTNDGKLTHKITHPKSEIKKTYLVKVKGIITDDKLTHFRKGVDIGGYTTAPADIEIIKINNINSLVKVVIHEGKNRQIRRMMESLGHPVQKLKRIAIGKISLDNLPKGHWRYLTNEEVKYLKSI